MAAMLQGFISYGRKIRADYVYHIIIMFAKSGEAKVF